MTIQHFLPSLSLRPYIKQYYLIEGDFSESMHDVFFADGCIEVVFNQGLDFYRREQKEPWAKVIGQIKEPLEIKVEGRGKSFGIWFSPDGFSKFAGIAAHEINDQAIPLDCVFATSFSRIVGDYLEEGSRTQLIEFVDDFFLKKANECDTTNQELIAQRAIERLNSQDGEVQLDNILLELGISARYLQKIFLNRIGLTPKQFQNVIRFQKSLTTLAELRDRSLTHIAYQCGYYDQSHFIREFKRFTGLPPSQYHRVNHPINQYFIKQ